MWWDKSKVLIAWLNYYLYYLLVPIGFFVLKPIIALLVPGVHHRSKLHLRNRTVLITGASTGLGRQLAISFHSHGAKVILTARSLDKLKEICEELKALTEVENAHEPVYKYLDVCEPKDLDQILALSLNNTIDVLVNNAGLSMRGSCSETPMKIYRQVMEVNYFGAVAVTQAFLSYIPEDGAIIYISSMQGRVAVPYRSAYSASKHAGQAFFDSLRCEKSFQKQILVVSAAYMNTGFGRNALSTEGKPTNKEDSNQMKGLKPEYAAERILNALVGRKTELILAPLSYRIAIFLRWFYPDLLFWIMHRRGLSDESVMKKKQ